MLWAGFPMTRGALTAYHRCMPIPSVRPLDLVRREASAQLDPSRRAELGQFMTPSAIADFMASLFTQWPSEVRLLDPGAGIGSLTEAFAARFMAEAPAGAQLDVTGYEIDPVLLGYLHDHLSVIAQQLAAHGHNFQSVVHDRDFIHEASFSLGLGGPRFTHAILNPPYKKIATDSEHRRLLRGVGIETVNLYTAFLGLTIALMADGAEIVAIIPRSFCNGTYFRPFRQFLLERAAITHLHVFESRTGAFKDDAVLQENVIVHLVRGGIQGPVRISTAQDPGFADYRVREFPFAQIVQGDDPDRFIRIPTFEVNGVAGLFTQTLDGLGLAVCTGPVVDFRMRAHCQAAPRGGDAPLLYAHHFQGGGLTWPKAHKKPNAVAVNEETRKWLMPRGCYTLTKRFSAKEERRRLVAFVVDPDSLPQPLYGFENHLNVFHSAKAGIPEDLARGLALFLNSSIVDRCFRNFSGHTQVNATDLRALRYPERTTLIRFGQWARQQPALTQEAIDAFVERPHGH